MTSIAILGDGGWGTAFGLAAHSRGHDITIWGAFPQYIEEVGRTRINRKFLDGFEIPPDIRYETDIVKAAHGREYIINATPTQWVRSVFTRLAESGFSGGRVVSLSKGIENKTLLRATEIISERISPDDICVLSGPSHAEEVARSLPASLVAASASADFAEKVQQDFSSSRLRIYSETDIVGVEIAGALKNVIAVAAGICDGLELGDNAKSALLTRGIVEMARLGAALGAKPATFYGLSGIGDLATTCFSGFGRNRGVGMRIGKGESLDDILKSMEQVAEGVWTVKSVVLLADKLNVTMPIADQVYKVLFENTAPLKAVESLMSRDFRQEKEEWENISSRS